MTCSQVPQLCDGKSICWDREAGRCKGTPWGTFTPSNNPLPRWLWGTGPLPVTFPALCPQEQSTARKDAILKMLAGLLDGVDAGREAASPELDEDNKLEEERAALGRLAQLSQRDRKAPCKNFFWKTFTSC